jgi:hypothetical protein
MDSHNIRSRLMIEQGIYTNKKLLIVLVVISIALATDVALWNISMIAPLPSGWSVPLFFILISAFAIGQYPILAFIRGNNKNIIVKASSQAVNVLVIVIQFILIVLLVFVALQISLTAEYSTAILSIISTISYALGITIMGILSLLLFSWYKLSKSLVILMYGISAVVISIALLLLTIQTNLAIAGLPPERNSLSEVRGFFELGTTLGNVQYVGAVTNAVSFFLLWFSTALLLKHYARKMGVVKFSLVMSIPLISLINQYVVVTPIVASVTNPDMIVYVQIFGNVLPGIVGGVLFGVPFWAVARTIDNNAIRDYMIIAMWGSIFLQLTGSGAAFVAAYPPFGVFCVFFTGLACYLILIGIYSSAASTSGNASLRKSIRKLASEETRLLDTIGMAKMEQEMKSKILQITKEKSDLIFKQTGVNLALTDEDVGRYLTDVLNELKKVKTDNTAR